MSSRHVLPGSIPRRAQASEGLWIPGTHGLRRGQASPGMTATRDSARRSNDLDLDVADVVDVAVHDVALLDGADAGRGAGEDQVALLQLEQAGEGGDLAGDVPDHLGKVAGLLALAVDVEPDRALGRVLHARRRHQGRAGGRLFERL